MSKISVRVEDYSYHHDYLDSDSDPVCTDIKIGAIVVDLEDPTVQIGDLSTQVQDIIDRIKYHTED